MAEASASASADVPMEDATAVPAPVSCNSFFVGSKGTNACCAFVVSRWLSTSRILGYQLLPRKYFVFFFHSCSLLSIH